MTTISPTSHEGPNQLAGRPLARVSRSLVSVMGNAVGYVFFLAVLAVATIAIVIPKISDAIPMTILSNSMAPSMPVGSLAVVRPTMDVSLGGPASLLAEDISSLNSVAELDLGDVIAFQPVAEDSTLVIHRIVGISVRADHTRQFIAKGDNNTANEVVEDYMVRGVVWYHVPYLGYVNSYVNGDSPLRSALLMGIIIGLYLWTGVLIYKAMKYRSQRRKIFEQGVKIADG